MQLAQIKTLVTGRAFAGDLASKVESGIISTVGLLSGIAIAGISGSTVFLTGLVYVFAQAFNAAAESYFAEYRETAGKFERSIEGTTIMFVLAALSGFLPLLTYMTLDTNSAFSTAFVVSFSALFIVSLLRGRRGQALWHTIMRMAVVAAASVIAGAIVGTVLR